MVRNFLFHRVNPKRDKLWDPMDVSLFEKCIKYISSNYEVVLIEDLVFSGKLHQKKNLATIMFDDGYKDNIQFAAPILAKYNCKASFYIVTDCIDQNKPTWTHILEHLFQYTSESDLDLDFAFLPTDLKVKKLDSKEERIKYVSKLKPSLKKLSHTDRNKVLNKIIGTYSDVELPELMMDWHDLKELRKAGHYIGSHTVSHAMLGTMRDETEMKQELTQSGNIIKEHLGYFPLSISYPVGSYNETTKRLAKESGYKMGLAVKQKTYDPAKEDLFEIPRIELYNESWFKTRLRITNTLETVKKLIRYK